MQGDRRPILYSDALLYESLIHKAQRRIKKEYKNTLISYPAFCQWEENSME